MHKPIKTGILSFGMSGRVFHAPFLDVHPEFELAAVVERSSKKAQAIYPEINSYDTIEELLADSDIELVVVTTPSATHFDFALRALQAGKHVLVEKPFCVDVAQAERLYAEAKNQNRHVLPYQNRRYDTDFNSVKNIIASGELGDIIEVHIRHDRYRYGISPKVAKESPIPGGGLLYDIGPHLIDAALVLFGTPDSWSKRSGLFRPKTQVDDYTAIQLHYPNGLHVFLTMSLLVADPQPAFIINGTKGSFVKHRADIQEKQLIAGMSPLDKGYSLEESDKKGILTTVSEDGEKLIQQITAPSASYLQVFSDVYDTIRNNKPYPVTQGQILKQMEIIE